MGVTGWQQGDDETEVSIHEIPKIGRWRIFPVMTALSQTAPSCFITAPRGSPVAASHSRAVPLSDHDRTQASALSKTAPGGAWLNHRQQVHFSPKLCKSRLSSG